VVCGKPAEPFFHAAAAKLGLAASEILMIGDDIDIDVGGAQRAGLHGALVRTGKFRSGDLNHAVKPDVVLESIGTLPGWWDSL
jgi:ribonucleotide monophosphatase NagD (HAD superfamily)